MMRCSTSSSSLPRNAIGRLALAAFLGLATPALAVDVDPLRLELTGAPGQTLSGTLTIANPKSEPVRIAAQAGAYRYVFTAHTIPPNGAPARLPSCESWITLPAEALAGAPVPERSAIDLTYTITIPETAWQAGEYVAALLIDELPAEASAEAPAEASAEAPAEGSDRSTITIRPRIAIPVYVLMGGLNADGRIAAMSADTPQAGTTRLLLTIANDGPIHIRPTGSVIISDEQGAVVSRLPLGRTIPIFPKFQEGIPFALPTMIPGRYQAVATVQIGASNLLQQTLAFMVAEDGRVHADR